MQGVLVVSDGAARQNWAVAAMDMVGLPLTFHRKPMGLAIAVANAEADVIVLDAAMPGLDVAPTCQVLRRWRPRLGLVVIADGGTPVDLLASWRSKADVCIVMPSSPEILAEAVATHLPVRRLPQFPVDSCLGSLA